ncbi:MAG: peptide deformylase [Bacteroidales bacterium]|nr:peptide deformylase [Bacteroidales bacterium]MCR5276654.1 peptide deformylase [Bacteroidales bacterium]
MIKPIYLYGAEVLRRKADEADLNRKEELQQLITDLHDTLARSEGCGLAAPQIGVSLRVLVVDGDEVADTYDYLKGFKRTMINPVIVSESEKQNEYSEGCLSVPGIYADVTRPAAITVEYYNERFEKVREDLDKFAARMVQHEMSHLDGVLFTDLLPPIRRKMLSKKLGNISHGKVSTVYNTKIK